MESSSWIRAMFEEGEMLKKAYGADAIFDFTLGNPIAEPPQELKKELCDMVLSGEQGMHRYMSNSGYAEVREQIAGFHKENSRLPFTQDHIIMTVGSAGGINVALKAILDPGDEVLVLSPFFVEFMFYIENHGGVMRLVETTEDFRIDVGCRRGGDHGEDEGDHRQLAEQPDGRRLPRGRDTRPRRRSLHGRSRRANASSSSPTRRTGRSSMTAWSCPTPSTSTTTRSPSSPTRRTWGLRASASATSPYRPG